MRYRILVLLLSLAAMSVIHSAQNSATPEEGIIARIIVYVRTIFSPAYPVQPANGLSTENIQAITQHNAANIQDGTMHHLTKFERAVKQLEEVANWAQSPTKVTAPTPMQHRTIEGYFNAVLDTSVAEAEVIRDSYSYFNPKRYILSMKIGSLETLRSQSNNAANLDSENPPQKALAYQKSVIDTIKNFISWVK